jgi:hypothetical protein
MGLKISPKKVIKNGSRRQETTKIIAAQSGQTQTETQSAKSNHTPQHSHYSAPVWKLALTRGAYLARMS